MRTFLSLLTSLLIAPAVVPLLTTALVYAQTTTETDAAALLVEANHLLYLGIQQYQISQFQEALQSWDQALELYRNSAVQAAFPQESRQGEGIGLNNLGEAYRNLGQYQEAIDLYEQALDIIRKIGDRNSEIRTLLNLGLVYLQLEQYQQALESYEQALAGASQFGHE
ncbi:MAG: tetratricopeptide repeat protein [Elainellaceae cyanobacterium]